MVGGLKIIRVKPGLEAEFERLFGELREVMRTTEMGCLHYSLLRSRVDPRGYIVHEQYLDQAALDLHESSEHGRQYFPRIRGLLESISVEYFEVVVK